IGVGGKADAIISPQATEELMRIVSYLRECQVSFIPVGNWTNLIVKDGGYRGAIICLKGLHEITVMAGENDLVSIYAGAGVALSEIVSLSVTEALDGIEFCAGIPGSVGGAVKMNAGAYGSEIKDIVEGVNLLNKEGEIIKVGRDGLNFAYRKLDLPEGSIITGASFLLKRGKKEAIRERISEICGLRKKKHPLEYRSAGSIFKNPPHITAGQIIDETGLKGVRIGNAKISERHGNFIVNLGHAKASDILALIDTAKEKVLKKNGIVLEVEVVIIGDDK
ncbi:MAG: UDP-N-acetylmuramate dehydrogenase, partial [Syntrophales bacterium]|nr:UDP-N-acetylmuramate dehydrogenase [Syntrophales bacterium]